MNTGDVTTLTYPLYQWCGKTVNGSIKAVYREVFSKGTVLTIRQDLGDGFLDLEESFTRQHVDVSPGLLRALTMNPMEIVVPCTVCGEETDHPWSVCPKCLRDPEINECEWCLAPCPGVAYSCICSDCMNQG